MGQPDQVTLIRQLGRRMSEFSKRCWHAVWLIGTEFLVPELCRRAVALGRAQGWGLASSIQMKPLN